MDNNGFCQWLLSAIADRQAFEEEAEQLYSHICHGTGGWASPGKILVLNRALSYMNNSEEYLEVGTYTGRSLAGALYKNDSRAQVIDPFELFLPDGHDIYKAWQETVQKFDVESRVTLHKCLCQDFDKTLPPIGVLYLDGDHDSGHTYEALKHFEKYLSDRAIIVLDDYTLFGGYQQKPFPGYTVVIKNPVQVDVDRWLAETAFASAVCILPWENRSMVVRYERK